MENIPEREVRSSQGSADGESNAAFAQKMGELIESESEVVCEREHGNNPRRSGRGR